MAARNVSAAVDIAVAIIERRGRVLVARRLGGAHLAGTWEFPGGKIERGERPEEALRRETREEVGLEIASARPLAVIEHDYPDRRVRLHFFVCRAPKGRPRPLASSAVRWIRVEELRRFEIPVANRAALRRFVARRASRAGGKARS